MPFTIPRSTAQMTGCCWAADPNGHCSAMMASDPPRASAWAANPWAVNASATACSAARKERCALARRHVVGEREAVLVAHLLGHRLGLLGRHERERPAEQDDEQVVAAGRELELHLLVAGAVALRRPARAGVHLLDAHLQVPAGGQLVEVVAGHVGMQGEPLGHLGGRDALVAPHGRRGRCRGGWGRRTRW